VVVGQVVHGMLLAVELTVVTRAEVSLGTLFLVPLGLAAGAALGGGFASALTTHGVTPGMAHTVTLGTLWGLWHGGMLGVATGAFANAHDSTTATALGMGAGQLAGLALSVPFGALLQPSAGQALFAYSGGSWSAAMAGLVFVTAGSHPTDATLGVTLLVASDLGLVASALFASMKPMSATRVALIDGIGLLGMFAGWVVAINLGPRDADGKPVIDAQLAGGLALAGAATGLAFGYYATAPWDEPDANGGPAVALSLTPAVGGALASVNVVY
jgi:hypothetical protein